MTARSTASPASPASPAPPVLELVGVTRRFGGLLAVDEVSFEVHEGEIVGLIGPNGAGKSTLFNAIVGTHPPTSGTVRFQGTPITGLPPHRIARLGIAKTHQIPKPLPDLTVVQNAMVGAAFGRANAPLDRALELADEALDFVGLAAKRDLLARSLNASEKNRLELARTVAARPHLYLLDEIAAGLNPTEVGQLLDRLRELRDRGATIVMVEHVMQAVMGISDRLVVLEEGVKIAEGTPAEVARDARVIDAYFGESEDGEAAEAEGEAQAHGVA